MSMNPRVSLLVGVTISVVGSTISNLGQNIQKYAQELNDNKPKAEQAAGYTSLWRWWGGLALVIFGSLFDVTALTFAPQSVIMPVGSFTLAANLYFASKFFGETLSRRDGHGTAMIVIGACLVAVAHGVLGEIEQTSHSSTELIQMYLRWEMGVFAGLVGGCMFFFQTIIFRCEMVLAKPGGSQSPEYLKMKTLHPVAYAAASGTWGALSVLFAKSTMELVMESITGENQFTQRSWTVLAPYCLVTCMLCCILIQTHYLARGLKFFDALFIIPVFQCFFIILSIMGGALYFSEFAMFNFLQWIVFIFAVLLTIGGILLLSSREMVSSQITEDEELVEERRNSLRRDSINAAAFMQARVNLLYNELYLDFVQLGGVFLPEINQEALDVFQRTRKRDRLRQLLPVLPIIVMLAFCVTVVVLLFDERDQTLSTNRQDFVDIFTSSQLWTALVIFGVLFVIAFLVLWGRAYFRLDKNRKLLRAAIESKIFSQEPQGPDDTEPVASQADEGASATALDDMAPSRIVV